MLSVPRSCSVFSPTRCRLPAKQGQAGQDLVSTAHSAVALTVPSGTFILAKLGLIGDLPACTDLTTKPWVVEAGINVIDAPVVAHGNVATAGGCLAPQYLAAWMIACAASMQDV